MEFTNIAHVAPIITAIAGLIVAFWTGAKWLLTHIEKLQAQAALTNVKSQSELSVRLHEEIAALRLEINLMHSEKRLYLRRIFQLESFIHNHPGVNIPVMADWPPN